VPFSDSLDRLLSELLLHYRAQALNISSKI
jgi:hypothetical protein